MLLIKKYARKTQLCLDTQSRECQADPRRTFLLQSLCKSAHDFKPCIIIDTGGTRNFRCIVVAFVNIDSYGNERC